MNNDKIENENLKIRDLLPNKKYPAYENFYRILGLIFVIVMIFFFTYTTYISYKFRYRNIENANVVIESTEKFSEQEIQEFIKIAKADFIKYDTKFKNYITDQDKVFVLNSLNFIKENEFIETKDVIVFYAQYDFYKEPIDYLFRKKKVYDEYWIFIRNNKTNQYRIKLKKGTFSPDDIFPIYYTDFDWGVR